MADLQETLEMIEPRATRRTGFQFHLSGLVVVTLMSGYLFWINFLTYRGLDTSLTRGVDVIGWPFPIATIAPVFREETIRVAKSGPLAPGESRTMEMKLTDKYKIVDRRYSWHPTNIALDAAVALGVVFAIAVLAETGIRSRLTQADSM
ncbi:MAG: hypothetical protein HY291_00825 [Planctomycetes bacterium]|nr:hypothetical protein [Planctomycetota bacterium]